MLLVTKAHHHGQVSEGGRGGTSEVPSLRTLLGGQETASALPLPLGGLQGSRLRVRGLAVCRGEAPSPCRSVQEMPSEYREYADSFGKVSVTRGPCRRGADGR